MAVGATHQGEEEDVQPRRGHRVLEDPWPPWGQCHQGVSREEGGIADGTRPPTIRDDARRAAHRDDARLGAAP